MNPLKSNNIVAKVLQVYAYLNAAAGFILTLLINKELELDAVVLSIILASVLVVNFLIFALMIKLEFGCRLLRIMSPRRR